MCDCKCSCSCKIFDPKKPVQTRSGKKARIVVTDGKFGHRGLSPILAILENENGSEYTFHYTKDGRLGGGGTVDNPYDLINTVETREEYRTFTFNETHASSVSGPRTLKSAVDIAITNKKMSVVKCEYTDGVLTSIELLK